MKQNEFEKKLAELTIKHPSEEYPIKANDLLNDNHRQQNSINWSYVFAFCMLVSLAINVQLYLKLDVKDQQNSLVANNLDAQKSVTKYSIKQGAMIEHASNNDIVIIMENQ